MSFRPFIIFSVVFCLTALGFVSSAKALVLDWSTVTWSAGSLSNSYDIDPNSPGDDITLSIAGNTNTFQVDPVSGQQTPALTSSLEGGGIPGKPSLELATNMVPPNLLIVTVTFSSQYTLGVEGVSFTLFDIDEEQKQDLIINISALGIDPSNIYAATITNVGSSVSKTGIGFGQRLRGVANSPDMGASSANGNATISFGANAIQSFTFTFDSTPGGPKLQKLGLSDISFTPIPEINPALAVTALSLAATLLVWRRRSSQQAL